MKETLSSKREIQPTSFRDHRWIYPEEDVRGFINDLKEELLKTTGIGKQWENQVDKIIDKLAGEELIK